MKPRIQRVMGEITQIFIQDRTEPHEKREFFGMAAKILLPIILCDQKAPITGFESICEELVSFQRGFSEMNCRAIRSPRDPAIAELMKRLEFVSGVRLGKKRPRDLKKKLRRLRSVAEKTLRATQTSKPSRGSRVFTESLIASFVAKKPMIKGGLIPYSWVRDI